MSSRPLRILLPLVLCFAAPALARDDAPIAPADMRRHIEILASDAFEGRAPGTPGEARTTAYIVDQFRQRGLEPAGDNDGWFQAVPLVERTTQSHEVAFTANGRSIDFDQADIALQGREAEERIVDAPVIFAGHGVRVPERGIDQIAGTDVRGAVVIILLDPPQVPGFPSLSDRVKAMADAGAAAVIALGGPDLPWAEVQRFYHYPATKLATQDVPPIIGAMPLAAAEHLIGQAGGHLDRLLNDQPGTTFHAVTLPLRATLHVTTQIHAYSTNNVVGRIRGTGAGANGESLLYLAHWDHLGLCRPEGAAHRICNGAVDNASGVAMMIEIAGRLAGQPRPARDILFLATTSEEKGLLGAEYFATPPVVPIRSIVAAINMDTVAIAPAGAPVAEIGRGFPPLDSIISQTIVAAGRNIDGDDDVESLAQRQDGWALARAGVPSVMIGGGLGDPARLGAFLRDVYHSPADQVGPSLELDGAAEDANLLVAIGRRLADPATYQRPARNNEEPAQ